jgi:hypothetical protein
MPFVDDDLLMDYFDRAFHIYCPFYTSRQQRSRGWLLSLLRRECSSYHAAMALTELHRSKTSSHSTEEQISHHRLALQELQKGLAPFALGMGPASSTARIGLLTSILHLFFYEVSLQARLGCLVRVQARLQTFILTDLSSRLVTNTIGACTFLRAPCFSNHSSRSRSPMR